MAQAFALPRSNSAQGVRRYGFQGLSYEYIASVLPAHLGAAADGRFIVARVRERVCQSVAWLGIEFDVQANQQGAIRVSTPAAVFRSG